MNIDEVYRLVRREKPGLQMRVRAIVGNSMSPIEARIEHDEVKFVLRRNPVTDLLTIESEGRVQHFRGERDHLAAKHMVRVVDGEADVAVYPQGISFIYDPDVENSIYVAADDAVVIGKSRMTADEAEWLLEKLPEVIDKVYRHQEYRAVKARIVSRANAAATAARDKYLRKHGIDPGSV